MANGILEAQEAQKSNNPIKNLSSKIGNFVIGKNGDTQDQKEESAGDDDEAEKFVNNLPPCPASLLGARVISIELAGLVAGTSNRGDFEKKMICYSLLPKVSLPLPQSSPLL